MCCHNEGDKINYHKLNGYWDIVLEKPQCGIQGLATGGRNAKTKERARQILKT
jgi:hypothetical protein